MRRLLGLSALFAVLGLPSLALAKDTGEEEEEETDTRPPVNVDKGAFEEDEEEEGTPPPKRLEEADKGDAEDDPDDDLNFEDTEEDALEFEEDEEETEVEPRGPGEDTAELYRNAQKKADDMSADEEILMWEGYLKKYPKSLFKDRIERRMEELSAEMFGERVPGSDRGATRKDAAKAELNFSQPIQYNSIDPRTKLSAGVEVGIPNWFGPRVDFEWAFFREFSAHAGLRQEAKKFALVTGAKYALIKSARTGTILSGGLDVKLFTDPSYLALNPMVGFGQRLDVMEGLDVQAMIGMDAELQDPFGARYSAGLSAELHPNDTVSAFVETSMDFKHFGADEFDGPFRFMVATFGLRFNAAKPRNDDGDGRLDVGLGANTPYSINYWGYYRGAISANADYYL